MIMTQEQKELLFKDLCARLHYGVKGIITFNGDKNIFTVKGIFNILFLSDTECCHIEDFKPYLFPMSSMTEEQCYDFYCRFVENETDYNDFKKYYFDGRSWDKVLTSINDCVDIIDWLNKNHFDYRGLIEKGLAIDATGLNIY